MILDAWTALWFGCLSSQLLFHLESRGIVVTVFALIILIFTEPKWTSIGALTGVLVIFVANVFQKPAPSWLQYSKEMSLAVECLTEGRFGGFGKLSKVEGHEVPGTFLFFHNGDARCDRFAATGEFRARQTFDTGLILPMELRQRTQNIGGRIRFKNHVHFQSAMAAQKYPYFESLRAGLIFGEQVAIPPLWWEHFNRLGLSHLLVVSGSHFNMAILFVSLILMAILKCLPRTLPRYTLRVSIVVAVVVLVLFWPASVPTWRSALSLIAILVFPIFWKPAARYRGHQWVAMVGFAFAILFPFELFSKSYVLSFGCAWFLMRAGDELLSPNPISGLAIASIGSGFLLGLWSVPLQPTSLFSNLFIAPLFCIGIVPLCLMGSLWPGGQWICDAILKEFILAIFKVDQWFVNHLPTSSIPFALASSLVAIFIGIFLMKLAWNRKLAMILAVTLLAQTCSWLIPFIPYRSKELKIFAIDVGQGDAILIQADGKKILIDGGDRGEFLHQVASKASNHFDAWILSHFDLDHVGNFAKFERIIKTERIIVPRVDHSSFSLRHLKGAEQPIEEAARPTEIDLGAHRLRIQSYASGDPRLNVTNDDSLVTELWSKQPDRLIGAFTGDLGAKGEREWLRDLKSRAGSESLSIDLFKAGHHGSMTSSHEALIKYLRPKHVIFTVGRQNMYRFPRASILDRFRRQGARMWSTHCAGSFEFRFLPDEKSDSSVLILKTNIGDIEEMLSSQN